MFAIKKNKLQPLFRNQTYIWIDSNVEKQLMKKCLVLIFLVCVLQCCKKGEKDVAGLYVKSPSVNTLDSLFLYTDKMQHTNIHKRSVYKYIQRFYNKKTRQLLFENISTWWINDNGRLELDNLYLDTDNNPDDYSHTPEAIKNAVISSSLILSGFKIIVDEDENVFYTKIK
jgi:hypothetical protein